MKIRSLIAFTTSLSVMTAMMPLAPAFAGGNHGGSNAGSGSSSHSGSGSGVKGCKPPMSSGWSGGGHTSGSGWSGGASYGAGVNINKNIDNSKNYNVVNKNIDNSKNYNVTNHIKNIDNSKNYNVTKNIDNSKNYNVTKNIDNSKTIIIEKNIDINNNSNNNNSSSTSTSTSSASASANVNNVIGVNAAAAASAAALGGGYGGGGGSVADVAIYSGGNIGAVSISQADQGEAQEQCVFQDATVVKAIHAVCVSADSHEFPASHMIGSTWLDAAYEGEVVRCIPGSRLKVMVGAVVQSDQGMASSFSNSSVLNCAEHEALRHYKDGMLKCAIAVPVPDCTERTNLRRWGTADLFFSYRTKVCAQTHREYSQISQEQETTSESSSESSSSEMQLKGMALDGGVSAGTN